MDTMMLGMAGSWEGADQFWLRNFSWDSKFGNIDTGCTPITLGNTKIDTPHILAQKYKLSSSRSLIDIVVSNNAL